MGRFTQRLRDSADRVRLVWRIRNEQAARRAVADRSQMQFDAVVRALRTPEGPPAIPALDMTTIVSLTPDARVAAGLERVGRSAERAGETSILARFELADQLKLAHPAHHDLAVAIAGNARQIADEIARSVVEILKARCGMQREGLRKLERFRRQYTAMIGDGDSALGSAIRVLPPAAVRQAHEAWARTVR